jgi:hypothetical protein
VSRRSLIYVACFAAVGFFLPLWDLTLGFRPFLWWGEVVILRSASFEMWAVVRWWGTWRLFVLWPLMTSAVYGAVALLLARAFRRLPSRAQDPAGHRLTHRFILYFTTFGFLLVLWFDGFGFAPVRSQAAATFLWDACATCTERSGGWGAILVLAPANAAVYAVLGWIVGRALRGRRIHDSPRLRPAKAG